MISNDKAAGCPETGPAGGLAAPADVAITAAAGTGAPAAAEPPALRALHHVAVICSDYGRSRDFYTRVLGLGVVAETYRAERDSWKLDLSVGGRYQIELFSFPAPPPRPDAPEAVGLRHLAFMVDELGSSRERLIALGVEVEPIRADPLTGRRFCFFKDPDGLPLELYEASPAPELGRPTRPAGR